MLSEANVYGFLLAFFPAVEGECFSDKKECTAKEPQKEGEYFDCHSLKNIVLKGRSYIYRFGNVNVVCLLCIQLQHLMSGRDTGSLPEQYYVV